MGLHGLLGVEHRLAITPAASRPNSQRGIGEHALEQGGRQQEHGRNRWLMAALARHQEVRLVGEGGGLPPLGKLCLKVLQHLLQILQVDTATVL
jgi:hypothetical protein